MKHKMILMLVFALVFNFMTIPTMAEPEHSGEYSQEMLEVAEKVLLDLGLWQEFNSDEVYLTRAETAVIVCLICDVYEEYKKPDEFFELKKNYYKDVSFEHWAFKYISQAMYCGNSTIGTIKTEFGDISFGPMRGDGNGYFRPDDLITYQEFVKAIVESLEWGVYASMIKYSEALAGSYPEAYWNMAELLGLYPLKRDKMTKPLTKEDAIVLLYNTLKVPMVRPSGLGHLHETFDWIKEYKDTVQIRGYAKKVDDNTVVIDGKEYYGIVAQEGFKEGFVLCFYNKNDNSVVSCYPISSLSFDNPKEISKDIPQFGVCNW